MRSTWLAVLYTDRCLDVFTYRTGTGISRSYPRTSTVARDVVTSQLFRVLEKRGQLCTVTMPGCHFQGKKKTKNQTNKMYWVESLRQRDSISCQRVAALPRGFGKTLALIRPLLRVCVYTVRQTSRKPCKSEKDVKHWLSLIWIFRFRLCVSSRDLIYFYSIFCFHRFSPRLPCSGRA